MRYFHIQRLNGIRKEWRKGELGETSSNQFYKGILEGLEQISKQKIQEKGIIQRSRDVIQSNWIEQLDFHSNDYKKAFYQSQNIISRFENSLNQLFESHLQHLKWTREEIFEKKRQEIDLNLPSRKNCLWLSPIDKIESWWGTFENSPKKRIIELELKENGQIHIGDAEYLKLESMSPGEWEIKALNYWTGVKSEKPDLEILFEGGFKVINEFEKPSEIKTYT